MSKDKLSRSEIRALEKEYGGSKANARARQAEKNARRDPGQHNTRNNHEDNEEDVQIHKHGR